jgi:O-antigen ligase
VAFGAVYPWAYRPVLSLCGAAGVLGALRARRPLAISTAVLLASAAVVGVIALQLVPLPASLITVASSSRGALSDAPFLPLSVDPSATLRGLIFVVALGVFLLGTACALEYRDVLWIARTLLVVGPALAVIGIVQRAEATGRIYGFWQPYYGGLSFGPFINRNHFAGWMVMAIPVTLGHLWDRVDRHLIAVRRGWRDRLLWLLAPAGNRLILGFTGVMVMMVSLLLTMSRSGIVAIVVALTVFVAASPRRARRFRIVPIALVLVIAIVSVAWVGVDRIVDRFDQPDTIDVGERLAIWRDTFTVVRRFLLTGSGFNTYAAAMGVFAPRPFAIQRPFEAHNDYLQLVAEGGLPLTLAVACAVVLFARDAARQGSSTRSMDRGLRVGAVAGLAGIGVQECAEFSLQIPANAVLFAVLCSIVVYRR